MLALMLAWPGGTVSAQSPFDAGFTDEAKRIQEELYLFTDRSLYAVDENIHFVADHRVSGPVGSSRWSSILYVELMTPGGQSLVRGKYLITGGKAEGSLHIPAEAVSGSYYIRCYTRWMRNRGPGSFSYIPLKIVNPHSSEVANNGRAHDSAVPAQRIAYKTGMLECSAGSGSFTRGQEAVLQVRNTADFPADQLSCCISVVPAGAIDLKTGQLKVVEKDMEESFQVDLLPDLGQDVSISGTVIGPDQEAVPYTKLHFSLLGENPDYFAAISDEHGKFVISTPTGTGQYKEFFVTPELEDETVLEVRIDQEYDPRLPGIASEQFRLSDQESELARKIALNMQLSKAFGTIAATAAPTVRQAYSEGERVPFYGTEVKRLLIDDYVRLPNLEEIFINLIPEVQFYRKQGKKMIRILSDNSSIEVYKPLIMIDHISVFDHEALLDLSPDKIERIDLIDDIYLKGSVPFGGVLAIHSRKGDMAGIDLPRGSYFFDYQAFHPELPPVESRPVLQERIPDTRNTLLWSGNLVLQQNKALEVPFKAPDSKGRYVVLVRTVSAEGEVYAASAEFQVE
jgi:hypothetical protein